MEFVNKRWRKFLAQNRNTIIFGRLINHFVDFNWGNFWLLITGGAVALITTRYLIANSLGADFHKKNLGNILTANGVFAAILITYLFNRVTWTKERKLDIYNKAQQFSQKLTNFRRILFELTRYYNVWRNEKATKNLLDHGKYRELDFYEYRLQLISVDYVSKYKQLIDALQKEQNFSEGSTGLYLAMTTIVGNRSKDFVYMKELYNDYDYDGAYDVNLIERWLECNVMSRIWHDLREENYTVIDYSVFYKDKERLLKLAGGIDYKYRDYEFGNRLIGEIAGEMDSHYLPELRESLRQIDSGLSGLSLTIMILIACSLTFGVLAPFLLLMVLENNSDVINLSSLISGINAGMFTYFILKFPFLIIKEMKFG
jgi:hypothetical protein